MEEHLKKRIAAKIHDKYGFTVLLGTGMNTLEDMEKNKCIKPIYKICCSSRGEYIEVLNWTTDGNCNSYRSYYNFRGFKSTWRGILKRGRWNHFFDAVKIQRTFKRAISNPEYKMCRNRLAREFSNMSPP